MQRAGCSKLALGSPLLLGRGYHGDGVFLSKLSSRPAGGQGAFSSWPPCILHGPRVSLRFSHGREMRNICIFQPCKPKISGFSPSLSVPGCGRANSHWCSPADGTAVYPLAWAVVTKDNGMRRFQFWRPEAGPPGASRLALCRKDAPRPPARAGRVAASLGTCLWVCVNILRRAPVTLD